MDSTSRMDPTAAAERQADAAVQGTTLILAIAACIALFADPTPRADARHAVALAVYAPGLLAMAACSALYGRGRDGPRHALYRKLDKAAIFAMIGGTYTPFVLLCGGEAHALRLLAVVWTIALAGMLAMLAAPHRLERLSVPLYPLLGWSVLSDPGLLAALPLRAAALLVVGGIPYTVGVLFHRSQMPFQEAVWHGFVLAAAACHYAAIVRVSGVAAATA